MLAPMVVELVTAATAACPPAAAASLPGPRVEGVPAAVLAKEAAYAAAAAASFDLHDYIDFGPWFRGALLQVCYLRMCQGKIISGTYLLGYQMQVLQLCSR